MIIADRLEKIQSLSLKAGSHTPDSTFCVMEAVAFVAGETWSDAPKCACPVISAFLRSWNDALPTDADRDRLLKPLIPKLVGTKNKALENRRAIMATDWLIRAYTPAWLRAVGLTKQAELLEALPEITKTSQFASIRGPLEAIRDDASAAWSAAESESAAWNAAWSAAANAAREAAESAARSAAWSAAANAAANAAWNAAWSAAANAARSALSPVVEKLQQSALQLVERMIEVQE